MASMWEKKNFIILQKQPPKMLWKKGVLKNFAILTRKHLCRSLFAGLHVCNLLIRDTNTYFFLWILRNFKEHHFEEHLRTTASYFMNKNRNNSSKKNLINRNLWVFNFVNWHVYKEKFKEIACKSKQMPGGKLSRLGGT